MLAPSDPTAFDSQTEETCKMVNCFCKRLTARGMVFLGSIFDPRSRQTDAWLVSYHILFVRSISTPTDLENRNRARFFHAYPNLLHARLLNISAPGLQPALQQSARWAVSACCQHLFRHGTVIYAVLDIVAYFRLYANRPIETILIKISCGFSRSQSLTPMIPRAIKSLMKTWSISFPF